MKKYTLLEAIQFTNVKVGAKYSKIPTLIKARMNDKERILETYIDGELETTKSIVPGDMIITGPKNEEYSINQKKFFDLYVTVNPVEDLLINNEYISKPVIVQAVQCKTPFTFTAPWGEDMICKEGDYFVYRADNDAYRIEKEVFDKTYKITN